MPQHGHGRRLAKVVATVDCRGKHFRLAEDFIWQQVIIFTGEWLPVCHTQPSGVSLAAELPCHSSLPRKLMPSYIAIRRRAKGFDLTILVTASGSICHIGRAEQTKLSRLDPQANKGPTLMPIVLRGTVLALVPASRWGDTLARWPGET